MFAEVGWTENHDSLDNAPPLFGNEDADLDIISLAFKVKFDPRKASAFGGSLFWH